jgi:hypothetical protein
MQDKTAKALLHQLKQAVDLLPSYVKDQALVPHFWSVDFGLSTYFIKSI